ncbi:MAG TPA: c-type cytochrome [Gammaproteobacteria bacterium]|nr:c-type cytochrome [Gammaproteobacteria bacterium]
MARRLPGSWRGPGSPAWGNCGSPPPRSRPAPEGAAPPPLAAAPPTAPAAPAGDSVAAAGAVDGQKVYNNVCALCHAAGVAGAPMPGNKDDWGPRIAQGKDTLYKHALEGFTGQKGMMPARGGNASLTDEEVKAAVDFMVQKSS